MIKIETDKIEKWEEIKKRHKEYVENIVKPKINFIIKYELHDIEKSEIDLLEKLLNEFEKIMYSPITGIIS